MAAATATLVTVERAWLQPQRHLAQWSAHGCNHSAQWEAHGQIAGGRGLGRSHSATSARAGPMCNPYAMLCFLCYAPGRLRLTNEKRFGGTN